MSSCLEALGRPPTNSYQIWSCRSNVLACTTTAASSVELPDGLLDAIVPAVPLARARSPLLAMGAGKSHLGCMSTGVRGPQTGCRGELCQHASQSASSDCARIQCLPHPDLFSPCHLCGMVPDLRCSTAKNEKKKQKKEGVGSVRRKKNQHSFLRTDSA